MGDRVVPGLRARAARAVWPGRQHRRAARAAVAARFGNRWRRQRQRLAGLARLSRQTGCRLPRRPALQRSRHADQCGDARARRRTGPRQPRRRPDCERHVGLPAEAGGTDRLHLLPARSAGGGRPAEDRHVPQTCWSRKPRRPRRPCFRWEWRRRAWLAKSTQWPNSGVLFSSLGAMPRLGHGRRAFRDMKDVDVEPSPDMTRAAIGSDQRALVTHQTKSWLAEPSSAMTNEGPVRLSILLCWRLWAWSRRPPAMTEEAHSAGPGSQPLTAEQGAALYGLSLADRGRGFARSAIPGRLRQSRQTPSGNPSVLAVRRAWAGLSRHS